MSLQKFGCWYVEAFRSSTSGGTAEAEREHSKHSNDCYLETKATIWPRLSYMCYIRGEE